MFTSLFSSFSRDHHDSNIHLSFISDKARPRDLLLQAAGT